MQVMLFGKATADRKMPVLRATIGTDKGLTKILWQKMVFDVNWDINVKTPVRVLQALVEKKTGLPEPGFSFIQFP